MAVATAVRVDEDDSAQKANDATIELVARAAPPPAVDGLAPASVLEVSLKRKSTAAQKAAERKGERAERAKLIASEDAGELKRKSEHALAIAKEAEAEHKFVAGQRTKAQESLTKHKAAEALAVKANNNGVAWAEMASRKKAQEEVAAGVAAVARTDEETKKKAGEAAAYAKAAKRKADLSEAWMKAQSAAHELETAEDDVADKKGFEREANEKAERERAAAAAFHAAHRREEAEAAEVRTKQADAAAEVARRQTDQAEEAATKKEVDWRQIEDRAAELGDDDAKVLLKPDGNDTKEALLRERISAEPCALEGGTCYCVGTAIFAQKLDSIEHTLASPIKIKNADGNIGCNSKAFHNIGDTIRSGAEKACWCVGILSTDRVEMMAVAARQKALEAMKKAEDLDEEMRMHMTGIEEEVDREEHEAEAVIERVNNQIKKVEKKIYVAGRRAIDVAKQVDNN